MTNSNYEINEQKINKYIGVLEEVARDLSKSKNLPKGYIKLKSQEEKINLLEGSVLKQLNRKLHYKIYLCDEESK